jgi:eukaryotic-like serine/threonine-protein kinase
MLMSLSAPDRRQLGRYDLLSKIGSGGMAEVHLARQRGPMGFEKLVVVKLAHRALAKQASFIEMLHSEARVAALLKHSNVIDVYELGDSEGQYYIAMEYLEGEPLLALLRAGREDRPLDVLSMARIIADAAEGLSAVHELKTLAGERMGLIHHDVSPGNIMVLYSGQVKLLDFGVAKALTNMDQVDPNVARVVAGKLGYLAPEKLHGRVFDHRSDIFSLGVVMWEAFTCKRLFKFDNEAALRTHMLTTEIPAPSKVNANVPPLLDQICQKALMKDPAARFANANEMAAAIESVLHEARYVSKNDLIAKYMRDTFSDRHALRLQLIKEASTEAGPSQATASATLELNQQKQSVELPAVDIAELPQTPEPHVPNPVATRPKAVTGLPPRPIPSVRKGATLPAPFIARAAPISVAPMAAQMVAPSMPAVSAQVVAPIVAPPIVAVPVVGVPVAVTATTNESHSPAITGPLGPLEIGLIPMQSQALPVFTASTASNDASGLADSHAQIAFEAASTSFAEPQPIAPPSVHSPAQVNADNMATQRSDTDTFARWSRSSEEVASLPTTQDDDDLPLQVMDRRRWIKFIVIGIAVLSALIIAIMSFGGSKSEPPAVTSPGKLGAKNASEETDAAAMTSDAAAVPMAAVLPTPEIMLPDAGIDSAPQQSIDAAAIVVPMDAANIDVTQAPGPTPPKTTVAAPSVPPVVRPAVAKTTAKDPTVTKLKLSAADIKDLYQSALQKFMKGDNAA